MSTVRIRVEGADDLKRTLRSVADLSSLIGDECAGKIQETMRNTAVERLTASKAVDTGLLRNSIDTDDGYNRFVEKNADTVSVGIRTDVSYALFIEYGTGPRGDPEVPHTTKMSWVYPTDDPENPFRVAVSQKARPFMRPALYRNRAAFRKIIEDKIREKFA